MSNYFLDEESIIGGIVPQMNIERITLQDKDPAKSVAIIDVYVLEKIRTFMRDPFEAGAPQGGPQQAVNIGSWYNVMEYGKYFNIYAVSMARSQFLVDQDNDPLNRYEEVRSLLEPRNRRLWNIQVNRHGDIYHALKDIDFIARRPEWHKVATPVSLRDDILSISRHSANEHFDRVKYRIELDFPTNTAELHCYVFLHFDIRQWLQDQEWLVHMGEYEDYIYGIGGQLQYIKVLEENKPLEFLPMLMDESGIPWLGDFHMDPDRDNGLFTGAEPSMSPPAQPLSMQNIKNNIVVDNRSRDLDAMLYFGSPEYQDSEEYFQGGVPQVRDKELVNGFGFRSLSSLDQIWNNISVQRREIKERRSKQYSSLISRLIREEYPLRFGLDFYDDNMEHIMDPWDVDNTINNNLLDQLSEGPSLGSEPVVSNLEMSEGREGQVNMILSVDMLDFLFKKSVLGSYFPIFRLSTLDAFQGLREEASSAFGVWWGEQDAPARDDQGQNIYQKYFANLLRVDSIEIYRHKVGGLPSDREAPVLVAIGKEQNGQVVDSSNGNNLGRLSEVDIQLNELNAGNTNAVIRSFAITDWEISKISTGKYYYSVKMSVQDSVIDHFKREIKVLVAYKNMLSDLYNSLSYFSYAVPRQREYDPFSGSKAEVHHYTEPDATAREGERHGMLKVTNAGTHDWSPEVLASIAGGNPSLGIPPWNTRMLSYDPSNDIFQIRADRSPSDYLRSCFELLRNNYGLIMYDGSNLESWEGFKGQLERLYEASNPWLGGTQEGFSKFIKLFEDLILHYKDIFGFSDGHMSLDTQSLSSCGKSKIKSTLSFEKILYRNIFDTDAISSFRSLYIDIPDVYENTLVPVIGQQQLSNFVLTRQMPKYTEAVNASAQAINANTFFTYYSPYIYSWRATKKRNILARAEPDMVLAEFDRDSLNPQIFYRIERYLDFAFDKVSNQASKYTLSSQKHINSVSLPRLPAPYLDFEAVRLGPPGEEGQEMRALEIERLNALHRTVRGVSSLEHLKTIGLANISFFHRGNSIARWDCVRIPANQDPAALELPDFQGEELEQLRNIANLVFPNMQDMQVNRVSVLDQLLFASTIQRRIPLVNHMNDVVEDSFVNEKYGMTVASRADMFQFDSIVEKYAQIKQADLQRPLPQQERDRESFINLPPQIKLSLDDDPAVSAQSGTIFGGMQLGNMEDVFSPDHQLVRRSKYMLESLVEMQVKINLESGEDSWLVANQEVLDGLQPGQNYLCRLKYYRNTRYGFGPDLVEKGTEIVDRVFLLNYNGGVIYPNPALAPGSDQPSDGFFYSDDNFAGSGFDYVLAEGSSIAVGDVADTNWHSYGSSSGNALVSALESYYGARGTINPRTARSLMAAESSATITPAGGSLVGNNVNLDGILPLEGGIVVGGNKC